VTGQPQTPEQVTQVVLARHRLKYVGYAIRPECSGSGCKWQPDDPSAVEDEHAAHQAASVVPDA